MALTQGFAGTSGGGAVTLAAGSVAAGAYVSGSLVDGAIATLGTEADAAVGDASGTVNSHIRQVAKVLTASLPAALVGGRLDVNVGKIPGTVSAANSSTTTLGSGAAFTGTAEDVSGYGAITVNVFADQASAAAGLSLQFSSDGTDWDEPLAVTVAASSGVSYTVTPQAQWFRVVYTNGASVQGAFRLQSLYHPAGAVPAVAAFADINATLSPTVIGQRVVADIVVQDPVGNLTNRVRSAAAMIAGAPGGALVGAGLGLYNVSANKFFAAIGNADGSLPVGGYTGKSMATLTRPANTTTYTANTAVANATSGAVAITFANCARLTGGTGFIIGADILDEANQTLKGTYELWLYNQAPGTVINDNANWAPANADRLNRVGIIKFDSGTVGNNASGSSGNCEFYDLMTHPLPFVCVGGTSLYGQLVVRNAYIPVSSEVFQIILRLSQD